MKKNKLNTIFSEIGCPADGILQKYLDGELTQNQKHAVEKHLIDCEMCSNELEGLKLMNNPEKLNIVVERINNRINDKFKIRKIKPIYNFVRIAAIIVVFIAIGSLFVLFNNKNIDSKEFLAENENPDSLFKPAKTTEQDTPKFDSIKTVKTSVASEKLLAQTTHGATKNQEKGTLIIDENLLFETTMTKLEGNKQKSSNDGAILDSTSLADAETKSTTVTPNSDNDTYLSQKTGEATSTGNIMVVSEEVEEELAENFQATNKEKKQSSQRQQLEANRPATKTIEQDEVIAGGYSSDNNSKENILNEAIDDYTTEKYADAKIKLEQIIQNNDFPYFQKTQWYYALTLIKLNKINEAKKVLVEIINTKNHAYNEVAERKLKEIEDK